MALQRQAKSLGISRVHISYCFNYLFLGSGRTLREGPLESSPIMKLLKQHFISSWSLLAEVEVRICNNCVFWSSQIVHFSMEELLFPSSR